MRMRKDAGVKPCPGQGAFCLQNFVTLLQQQVPPKTKPINIGKVGWLRDVFEVIFEKMINLAPSSDPYMRMLDSIVAVIINYDSVSKPGTVGGRHTVSLLNRDRFRIEPNQNRIARSHDEHITRFNEQNHALGFGRSRTVAPRLRRMPVPKELEDFWFRNWREYLQPDEQSDRYTLNNMLLRRAKRPRPVFISWFEDHDPAREATAEGLTSLAINLNALANKSQRAPAPDVTEPVAPPAALERFAAEFADMFDLRPDGFRADRNGNAWEIEARAVGDMLRRFQSFFGAVGGNSFFSIPVELNVDPDIGEQNPQAELRAVVSVLLSDPRDGRLQEETWRFFDGMASRILTSIMASESMGHAHQRWQRARANSVFLASHPLKHRLQPIGWSEGDIERGLKQMLDELDKPPARQNQAQLRALHGKLLSSAIHIYANVEIARGLVNGLGVLADLGPEMSEKVRATVWRSDLRSIPESQKIDLFEMLRRAAAITVDKVLGENTVNLVGCEGLSYKLVSRFLHEDLKPHRRNEEFLYMTMFLEFLQNAANYGVSRTHGDKKVVDVHVHLTNDVIFMENAIKPAFVDAAKAVVAASKENRLERKSSGLFLANELLSTLHIADIHIDHKYNKREIESLDSDVLIWQYKIVLKGR